MHKAFDGRCTIVIAEVAVPVQDAALQLLRVGPVQKHLPVVIGLQHHRIGLRAELDRFLGHPAAIGNVNVVRVSYADRESHGLRGIVRNHEVPDLDFPLYHLVPFVFGQYVPASAYVFMRHKVPGERFVKLLRSPNRLAEMLAEGAQ